jgi:membrane protein
MGVKLSVPEKIPSFGMVLSIGFLLLVSLVLSTALAAVGKFFGGLLPIPSTALAVF